MTIAGPLKVSAKSSPNAVAGALAAALRERERVELQAVGAGAINQAIKAVAIARNYLRASGTDAICVPAFVTVAIGDNERTGISLLIERRPLLLDTQAAVEDAPATSPEVEAETTSQQPRNPTDTPTAQPTVDRALPTSEPNSERAIPTSQSSSEREIPTNEPNSERKIPTSEPSSERKIPTTQARDDETPLGVP